MTEIRRIVRFGIFEIDLVAGEVRRNGYRVKLQEQPFQILAALLERPGEVITKEQLQHRLWSDDTYVDFDRSIATAIRKVRQALGDSATRPRFIETIPKRGYRFIGNQNAAPTQNDPEPEDQQPRNFRLSPWALVIAIGAAALVVGVLLARIVDRPDEPPPLLAQPLTADPGYELWPSFSPDGQYISFAGGDASGKTLDVYTLHLGSRARLRITSDTRRDYSPAWSPKGDSVAFLRDLEDGTFGLYLVPPLGGPERLLTTVASTAVLQFAEMQPSLVWTHDGRYVVVSDREGDASPYRLVRVDIKTGEKEVIEGLPPSGDGSFNPGIALDDRTIAFKTDRMGDLKTAALSDGVRSVGDVRKLTTGGAWVSTPIFLSEGIIFSAGDKFSRRLWKVGFDGNGLRSLGSLGDSGYHPTLSPSGDRLIYAQPETDFNVWRLDIDESGRLNGRTTIARSTRYEGNAAFSPDGKSIALESNRSGRIEVWTCSRSGENCVAVTDSQFSGSPRFSPDGTKVAFDSRVEGNWNVYVASVGGGPPVQLTKDESLDVAPRWSSDGRWIYFGSNRSGRGEVWRVPAKGGNREQVTRNGSNRCDISPDGRWLYVSRITPNARSNRNSQVWRMPIDGGDEQLVLDDVSSWHWAVTNDGIYYAQGEFDRFEIRYKKSDSGESRQVGTIKAALYPFLDVSADGRSLLVTQVDRQGSDLMIVDNFR